MTSLNPVLRVEEQLVAPLKRHLGLTSAAARERAIAALRQTGIPDPERNITAYPHELSGGMRQRVLIAMAIACEPRLLIADEPTTALDVTIQAQIVELLKDLSARLRSAVIFVTHDMGVVARFADRVGVMYAGRLVELGSVHEIFENPQHPYTRGLLASIPTVGGDMPDRLSQIDGVPPDLAHLPDGCAFAARCERVSGRCRQARPELTTRGIGHFAACFDTDSIAPGGFA
jgi:oligopeptide/dipeptide ABC transporter ATP-binding protein